MLVRHAHQLTTAQGAVRQQDFHLVKWRLHLLHEHRCRVACVACFNHDGAETRQHTKLRHNDRHNGVAFRSQRRVELCVVHVVFVVFVVDAFTSEKSGDSA